jgi:PLP dependent protein
MSINITQYNALQAELNPQQVRLVAVSKTKPVADIQELYHLGQRDFGENYVQELVDKQAQLPTDIRWHFIGHLQSNKVKYIAPFVHLIHGVDSVGLLKEISKQAVKLGRTLHCLLQVHIAQEATKFGFDAAELQQVLQQSYPQVSIDGLMGMASFSDDVQLVENEFKGLKALFDTIKAQHPELTQFNTLSMGMSGDYQLAMAQGSNMVRIGSMLFGARGVRVES